MDLRLTGYPSGFSEEGANGGSCANAAPTVPALFSGVFHPRGDVFEWLRVWGEQVQVGYVCCQLEVIDGEESVGILIRDNVGLYGSAKC